MAARRVGLLGSSLLRPLHRESLRTRTSAPFTPSALQCSPRTSSSPAGSAVNGSHKRIFKFPGIQAPRVARRLRTRPVLARSGFISTTRACKSGLRAPTGRSAQATRDLPHAPQRGTVRASPVLRSLSGCRRRPYRRSYAATVTGPRDEGLVGNPPGILRQHYQHTAHGQAP